MSYKWGPPESHTGNGSVRLGRYAPFLSGCVLVLAALAISQIGAQRPVLLRVGLSIPTGNARTGLTYAADSLRHESLGVLGADGRVRPGLARSWDRSPDGREWTFHLADGVRSQDGSLADAQKLASLLNVAVREPLEVQSHPGLREVEEIRAVGSSAILLRSKTARITLLDELTELSLGRGTPFAPGPFRIERLDENGFTAHAFSDYYRGRPGIDRVEYRSFRSVRSAWSALMRDEIDVLYEVPRDAVEFVESDPRVRVHRFLRPYVATLFLNAKNPLLIHRELRLALSRAIDRESIVRIAYRTRGAVARGPLWPTHWSLSTAEDLPGLDRAAATNHVRSFRKVTGWQGPIRFTCLVPEGLEIQPFERIALLLQKQLFHAGIDMQLESVSPREFLARVASGDFDAALLEFAAMTPSWVYSFWHSPSTHSPVYVRHGYAAADRELESMQRASTEEELGQALADVYQKMAGDPPAIFIAWPEVSRAVSDRFEVPVENGRDILGSNLRLWRPAPAQGGTR
jgi:ABC-type transport system substrate-binding protein